MDGVCVGGEWGGRVGPGVGAAWSFNCFSGSKGGVGRLSGGGALIDL